MPILVFSMTTWKVSFISDNRRTVYRPSANTYFFDVIDAVFHLAYAVKTFKNARIVEVMVMTFYTKVLPILARCFWKFHYFPFKVAHFTAFLIRPILWVFPLHLEMSVYGICHRMPYVLIWLQTMFVFPFKMSGRRYSLHDKEQNNRKSHGSCCYPFFFRIMWKCSSPVWTNDSYLCSLISWKKLSESLVQKSACSNRFGNRTINHFFAAIPQISLTKRWRSRRKSMCSRKVCKLCAYYQK